ncbi:MAG TPA: MBL fold metallo-hydrolase [Candidatus Nanoperiomorbaceae bacterium]|nr:MBL fold metallo-hydrolase [Candidatus Nanoperiomorbaceae bacterium]HMU11719.1 MBL fold metallo-hydrolase [Candidatus Nanoperiomorbaceae bacterium]
MDIEYRGENCVVVKCKKTIIVVDPTSESSVKEVNNPETIILLTRSNSWAEKQKGFIVDMPGEYEHNDISVKGIAVHLHTDEAGKNSTMYRLECDGTRVAVIGHTDAPLSEDDLEELGIIDVVVVPVGGGGYTLDARDAATIVRQITPKVVIPTHFADAHIKYEVPQEPVDEFVKTMGGNHEKANIFKAKGLGSLPESLTVVELARTA